MSRLMKIPLVGSTIGEQHCFALVVWGGWSSLLRARWQGLILGLHSTFIASVRKSPHPLENSQSQNPVGLTTKAAHCPLGVVLAPYDLRLPRQCLHSVSPS